MHRIGGKVPASSRSPRAHLTASEEVAGDSHLTFNALLQYKGAASPMPQIGVLFRIAEMISDINMPKLS